MNQVLLYSIQSEPIANILNGHKTIEVRKSDLPKWAKDKLARGEKVVGYGYCTKRKPYLYAVDKTYIIDSNDKGSWGNVLNGRVVVKFEVSKVTRHNPTQFKPPKSRFSFFSGYAISDKEMKDMCLEKYDLDSYGNGAVLYAHHFTNITPIEPMELGEFMKEEYAVMPNGIFPSFQPLTKAPQPFMTCWVKGE